MMKRHLYTLWKSHDKTEDAILLEDEPVYRIKRNSFKRAILLASKLPIGLGFSILVRKVSLNSDMCTEWKFEPIVRS